MKPAYPPRMLRIFETVRSTIERYLLLWLVALCALAYAWPHLAPTGAVDPFGATDKLALNSIFAVTMFCVGMLIPAKEISELVGRPHVVLGGTIVQYTTMPLLAFVIAKAFGFTGPWFIGIMLAGCVPGAMASNVLTLMSRGNVSYSVSLTTAATLLSPLVVPLTLDLVLAEEVKEFPTREALLILLWTVVGPVVAGHLLSRFSSAANRLATPIAPILANLAILWIIAVVIAWNREKMEQVGPVIVVALLLLNMGGYFFGWLGGSAMRIPISMRRALTLEVGMQNAGLGCIMATNLFSDKMIGIAPALYAFGCMLTGTVLAGIWARRPVSNESDASS